MKLLVFQAPHQETVPTSIQAGHPLSVFRLLQGDLRDETDREVRQTIDEKLADHGALGKKQR